MNHSTVRVCALLLVFGALIEARAQAPDANAIRTWHAAAGGFKVDAELLDLREGKVQLKKADGTTLWVPLDKLSLADVKFVNAEMAKARQAVEKSANNADGAKEAANEAASSETDEAAMDASEGTASDEMAEEDAEAADEAASSGGAKSKSAGRSPFAGMRNSNLVLGRASPHDITFSHILSPWVAVRQHTVGGQQYGIANIRTGKMFNPFSVEGHASVIALSPDGATMAAFTFPPKLSLYSTNSGKKLRDIEMGQSALVQVMAFISPTQLFVGGGFNQPASIYDVKSGKATKTIAIASHVQNKVAISPDGKWLAVPDSSVVALYDLKSGKLKSQLAIVPEAGKTNLSVHIDDLAFCSDGTELAVLGSSTTSEFQVFSVRSGRAVMKHTLTDRLSTSLSISQYAGPAIEAIPGNKGYILYGSAIIDREKGGPIWVDKPAPGELASTFRVMIDDERQLKLTSTGGAARFEIVKLPWSEISSSKDLVAKGGTVEDAGLPLVKNVSANGAKSVDAALNPKLFEGKRVDPDVAVRPNVVAIDRSLGYVQQVRFASPESGLCVSVPSLIGLNPNEKKKSVLVIDLKQGKVEKSVNVSFLDQVQDISPDGNWLIGTTGRNSDRVDLFSLKDGKHELGFRPLAGTEHASLRGAVTFLSNDTFLTISQSEATAWKFPELKAAYKFRLLGSAFRFPKSPLFLHRNEQGWYVRNASDGRVVGTLENSLRSDAEFARMVHFRADESAAAAIVGYDRDQKLVVWDLTTGKRTHDIALGSIAASRLFLAVDSNGRIISIIAGERQSLNELRVPQTDSVIWTGDNQLLLRWMRNDSERFAEGTNVSQIVYSLFDLGTKRMLWDYRVPIGALVEGGPEGQLWFAENSQKQQGLVGVKMPTQESIKKIQEAPEPKLLVAKGEKLMADVQVSISGDKLADGVLRDQVVSALVKNLATHDIEISERAGLKLTVRVERIGGLRGSFGGDGSDEPRLLASARLTDISDKILWQRDRVLGSQKAEDPSKPILAENVRRLQWENALDWVKQTIDPKDIYENWYYRGVGESLLSVDGEKLVELKTK